MNDDAKAAVEWARGTVESHDLYRGARDERDGSVENMRAILAHIDGEPARIAAAVADASSAALRAMSRAVKAEVRVAELERTLKERDEQSLFEGQREHEWNASFNATVIERAEKAEAERDEAQRGEQEAWRQTDQMRAERDAKHQLAAAEATARARAEADLRDMVAERDDERDQRIVAEVDRDRAHGAREVLGKLLVERDALRAQVEALERERDMLQTALRDNSAAHSETGKALLRAEAQVEAARAECGRIIDGMYSADSRYVAADVLRAMDGAKP